MCLYSKWVVRIEVCKRDHRPEVSGLLLVFVAHTQLERQETPDTFGGKHRNIRADSILVSDAGLC